FVFFAYTKISTKPAVKSQNVAERSLSTFDSSVSCLYFFEYEYTRAFQPFCYPGLKNPDRDAPVLIQPHWQPGLTT
ncbi:MAG: hypothetical protein KDI41_05275, partial [Pseudomonadales bacterium]|nr:hypothetical protein [Pseudomonadales bacterium]